MPPPTSRIKNATLAATWYAIPAPMLATMLLFLETLRMWIIRSPIRLHRGTWYYTIEAF